MIFFMELQSWKGVLVFQAYPKIFFSTLKNLYQSLLLTASIFERKIQALPFGMNFQIFHTNKIKLTCGLVCWWIDFSSVQKNGRPKLALLPVFSYCLDYSTFRREYENQNDVQAVFSDFWMRVLQKNTYEFLRSMKSFTRRVG